MKWYGIHIYEELSLTNAIG